MTHVIKFQAPFERLKFLGFSPEKILRRAIVLQAIIDASSNSNNNKELIKDAIEAKAWIFGRSDYFEKICYEAGLEPDFVVKVTREAIAIQKSKAKRLLVKKCRMKEIEELIHNMRM
jgi:hypothetical protein